MFLVLIVSSGMNQCKTFFIIHISIVIFILKFSIKARALLIQASASVAELFAASASHMIAADGFLDPEIAEGAHLVLGTPDILQEGLLVFVWV